MKLSEDAQAEREAIEELARAQAGLPDTSNRLKSTLGKWPGLFARLLLTYHVIEQADCRNRDLEPPYPGVVSTQNARRVAAFMRNVLLPHTLRADGLLFATRQTGHAHWIAGHILASEDIKAAGKVTARDITRAYGALRAPEMRAELQAVMTQLEVVGWVRAEMPENAMRPITTWHINPALYSSFATRAAAERDRRRKAQAEAQAAFRKAAGERAA